MTLFVTYSGDCYIFYAHEQFLRRVLKAIDLLSMSSFLSILFNSLIYVCQIKIGRLAAVLSTILYSGFNGST